MGRRTFRRIQKTRARRVGAAGVSLLAVFLAACSVYVVVYVMQSGGRSAKAVQQHQQEAQPPLTVAQAWKKKVNSWTETKADEDEKTSAKDATREKVHGEDNAAVVTAQHKEEEMKKEDVNDWNALIDRMRGDGGRVTKTEAGRIAWNNATYVFPSQQRRGNAHLVSRAYTYPSAHSSIAELGVEPRCALVFHRHVEKTGGSTLRQLVWTQEYAGEFIYWGYFQTHEYWTKMVDALLDVQSEDDVPRMYIEMHTSFCAERFEVCLSDILRIKERYRERNIGCPVLLLTFVRNPFDYYISFYRWAVIAHQRNEPQRWGTNITEWMPANLQSKYFLRAKADDGPLLEKSTNGVEGQPRKGHTFGDTERDIVMHDFLDYFDIVAPTTKYDEVAVFLRRLLSLRHGQFQRVQPSRPARCYECDGSEKLEDICPDVGRCRAAIGADAVSGYDRELFEKYEARFNDFVATLGEGFAAEVRAHRTRSKGAHGWSGGGPVPRKCKWVPVKKDADAILDFVNKATGKNMSTLEAFAPCNPPWFERYVNIINEERQKADHYRERTFVPLEMFESYERERRRKEAEEVEKEKQREKRKREKEEEEERQKKKQEAEEKTKADGVTAKEDNVKSASQENAQARSSDASRTTSTSTAQNVVNSTRNEAAAMEAFPGTAEEFRSFVATLARVVGPAPSADDVGQYDRPFVALAFANAKVYDMAMNWASSMNNVGMGYCLLTLDTAMNARIGANAEVNTSPLFLGTPLDGSNSHASSSWRGFAQARLTTMHACVLLGYNCVHSDIDIVWLRNPTAYFTCRETLLGNGNGKVGTDISCDGVGEADMLISSDNLSPARDRRLGTSSSSGTLNTGIFVAYHTPRGMALMATWARHLTDPSSPLHTKTSDQQILNAMIRRPNEWPGLSPLREAEAGATDNTKSLTSTAGDGARNFRLVKSNDGSGARIGFLPLDLFPNSHVAFVQRSAAPNPIAVHATYTLGGSFAAKRARFRRAGMWYIDPDAYHAVHIVTVDVPYDGGRLHANGIDAATYRGHDKASNSAKLLAHISMMRKYAETVRVAALVSTMLGAALELPALTCPCDKVWNGHDNIFKFACKYPGSEDADYLPINGCEMDTIYDVTSWDNAGIAYREPGFLSTSPAATNRSGAVHHTNITIAVHDEMGKATSADVPPSLSLSPTASTLDASALLSCMASTSTTSPTTCLRSSSALASGGQAEADFMKHIHVNRDAASFLLAHATDIEAAFVKTTSDSDARAVFRALKALDWCAECHYDNCNSHLDDEVLALGYITPTRGTEEKFCVHITSS